jgi:hypothetical protein
MLLLFCAFSPFLIGAILWTTPERNEPTADDRHRAFLRALRIAATRKCPMSTLVMLKRLGQSPYSRSTRTRLEPELTALRQAVADHIDWIELAWNPHADCRHLAQRIDAFNVKWRSLPQAGSHPA